MASPAVRLDPLRVADAAEMAGVLADPELYRVIGGAPPTVAELTRLYTAQTAGADWLNWVVRVDGTAVGYVQATLHGTPAGTQADTRADAPADTGTGTPADTGTGTPADTGTGTPADTGTGTRADIAWVIGTPWQHRGYATAAARAMLALLDGRGVRAVDAYIAPGHRPSEAVAERLGLHPTGEHDADGEQRWTGTFSP